MLLFFLACQPESKEPLVNEQKEIISNGQVRFVAIGDAGEGNDAQFASKARDAASIIQRHMAKYL